MTNDVFNVKKSKNKAISGRLCTYVQGIWTYTPPSDNITVCADNNETVDELDEDNNCLTNIWMCGDVRKDGFVTAWDVAVLNSKVAGSLENSIVPHFILLFYFILLY